MTEAMPSKPRAHTGFMRAIVRMAENDGVNTAPILARHGISADPGADGASSVDVQTKRNLYRDIAHASGDDFFFWKKVVNAPLDSFGYFGHLASTAATVGEAFESLARNTDKLITRGDVSYNASGSKVTVGYRLLDDGTAISRELSEGVVAFGILILRTALGRAWCPDEIYFEHARPRVTRPYLSQCDARYYFDSGVSAMSFDTRLLETQMPGANIYLQKAVENYVTDVVANRVTFSKIALDVRTEIAARIRDGVPPLEETASHLGMSARTLQRRLHDAGTSYSDILEDLRHELADKMLRDSMMTISEIGYTLGYADTSSFDRAYRSWTGQTPVTVRRHHG